MKCMINNKTFSQLAPKEKQKLLDALDAYNKEYLERETRRLQILITDNLMKLMVIACNETAKIGGQRMTRIMNKAEELIYHSSQDEIFFEHVDTRVKQILGEKVFDNFFKNAQVEIEIEEE